jgi:L-aspartate oxidase
MHVLVIGSGLAGLFAAVRAADAGHAVTIVTKGALAESNTAHAQGGIAAALFHDDSADAHLLDTLRAGAGLSDLEAAEVLVTEGPARVRDLIRFGVAFDRDDSGLARGLEAAHTRARVVPAGGDATGAAIERALIAAVRERAVGIHEHTMLADLLLEDSRVVGARLLHTHVTPLPPSSTPLENTVLAGGGAPEPTETVFSREREEALEALDVEEVRADAVILATGGAGQLYLHTTNPAVATADGVAAAWRAGAELADLEFVQFHPTALAIPGTPLVSEAVRGAGAVLLDEDGERFMLQVHPDAELAPRDVVARAIARRMRAQIGRPVLLDARAVDRLEERFPTVVASCRAAGIDPTREPVPVSPAAHYWMGGVATDLWGRTSLPGLYAVGEVACTGVHGANRLASNSLLEAAVFADRAVRSLGTASGVVRVVDARPASRTAVPTTTVPPGTPSESRLRQSMQRVMWENVGLERDADELTAARDVLAALERPTVIDRASLEDANLLDTARLVVDAALVREESRGAHFRTDFAEPLVEPAEMSPRDAYGIEEASWVPFDRLRERVGLRPFDRLRDRGEREDVIAC